MGWADFGRALYLNYSTAAGMLAETKLALRKEEKRRPSSCTSRTDAQGPDGL